jgi:hypothetical protein
VQYYRLSSRESSSTRTCPRTYRRQMDIERKRRSQKKRGEGGEGTDGRRDISYEKMVVSTPARSEVLNKMHFPSENTLNSDTPFGLFVSMADC